MNGMTTVSVSVADVRSSQVFGDIALRQATTDRPWVGVVEVECAQGWQPATSRGKGLHKAGSVLIWIPRLWEHWHCRFHYEFDMRGPSASPLGGALALSPARTTQSNGAMQSSSHHGALVEVIHNQQPVLRPPATCCGSPDVPCSFCRKEMVDRNTRARTRHCQLSWSTAPSPNARGARPAGFGMCLGPQAPRPAPRQLDRVVDGVHDVLVVAAHLRSIPREVVWVPPSSASGSDTPRLEATGSCLCHGSSWPSRGLVSCVGLAPPRTIVRLSWGCSVYLAAMAVINIVFPLPTSPSMKLTRSANPCTTFN